MKRLPGIAQKIRTAVRPRLRALAALLATLTFAFVAILFLVVVSYAGTFSISAIVGTSTTLLTVEGFLLGLSPLIKSKARVVPITLGMLSIISSLITISVCQVVLSLQTLNPSQTYLVTTPVILGLSTYQYYVITVVLFVFMLEAFWVTTLGNEERR